MKKAEFMPEKAGVRGAPGGGARLYRSGQVRQGAVAVVSFCTFRVAPAGGAKKNARDGLQSAGRRAKVHDVHFVTFVITWSGCLDLDWERGG